ncbi:P-loop containing nucleoside triphosphate hydrolase protein [Chaetomium tenue]|uniref:P-loop containing nucleoside triphosphate hydrolase protein n=1 Tax=Chaetomium tenue TaxID=1854479 RepID=A0ACB7PH48_9PEZI|nr:P-loop containing nucleoside triphosphate hydrolase protein [Chaetomium globosum]
MPPVSESRPLRPMQVLSLGMPKTGTASMAAAYRILGLQDVHHGIDAIFTYPSDFAVFSRAADATFPTLPTYTGKPFTRADWDAAFGPCEAVTDLAPLFAAQLIDAYPEAKVVLVEREMESWYRSTAAALDMFFGAVPTFFIEVVEPMIGSCAGPASKKLLQGYYGARTGEEAKANARQRYVQHYEMVRKMVPKEKILEFRLADGWGPLCEFLGKPVPDEPFPRLNEAVAFKNMEREWRMQHWSNFKRIYGRWVVAAGTMGLVYMAKRGGLLHL